MDKRVFPTINIRQTGTRKEELLLERTSSEGLAAPQSSDPVEPVEAI
jgi:transcription termination factor Rho